MLKERMKRVEELILEETADIIQKRVNDPRIGFVTVSRVKASKDMKNAYVYFTIFGDENSRKATIEGLEQAKGFIGIELGKRLRSMKSCPKIQFRFDDSLDYADNINRLLKKIEDE